MNKIFTILLLALVTGLSAQKLDFHVNPGFMLSQVDGDDYGGFRKLGYSLGAGFAWQKSSTFQIDWSTRVNQKGAREINAFRYFLIRTNYVESDLVFDYIIKNKVTLGLGAYYGVMLSGNANVGFGTYGYRRSDIATLGRVGLKLNDKLTLQTRLSYSLLSIRKKCLSYLSPCWYNRSLLFELSYKL